MLFNNAFFWVVVAISTDYPPLSKISQVLRYSKIQGHRLQSADYNNALHWLLKAAEQGDADAQQNMGVCYELGIGVKKDKQEAVKWYRKAAEQGNSSAKNNLRRLGY